MIALAIALQITTNCQQIGTMTTCNTTSPPPVVGVSPMWGSVMIPPSPQPVPTYSDNSGAELGAAIRAWRERRAASQAKLEGRKSFNRALQSLLDAGKCDDAKQLALSQNEPEVFAAVATQCVPAGAPKP